MNTFHRRENIAICPKIEQKQVLNKNDQDIKGSMHLFLKSLGSLILILRCCIHPEVLKCRQLYCKGRGESGKEHIYNQKHELVKGFAFKLLIWEMKKKYTEYYHIRLEIVVNIPPEAHSSFCLAQNPKILI